MKLPRSGEWLAPMTFAAFALLLLAVTFRYAPPAPKPASTSERDFSADRAFAKLADLIGDGAPHPTGSAANAEVRARIVAELARIGFAPEIQTSLVCAGRHPCTTVNNVVARLPGAASKSTVLLAAHYDSVAAGPGASDDGVGVAALLEVARILKVDPPARNAVAFLFDDGEEKGLLGAEGFEAENPLASDVRVVINLDARGTTGPSCMFETNHDNAWLIETTASALPRPVTSSLFYAVYKALPNDTDATVFKKHGKQTLNFAFIGRPGQYHTARDDLAHVDRGSLQHHGDNALSAARALMNVDLENPPQGDAVWFDVLALAIVHWPEGLTLGLAIGACLLVGFAVAAAAREKAITLRSVAWGSCSVPIIALGSTALGAIAVALLRAAHAIPTPWIAHPSAALIALVTAAIAVSFATMRTLSRRASPWAIWASTWIVWTVFATGLAVGAPSVSFLFLVPAIAAGVFGVLAALVRPWIRDPFPIAALPPILVAGLVWLPVLDQLYDALGLQVGALITLTTAILATSFASVIAGISSRNAGIVAIGASAVTAAALVVALAMPA